MRKQKIGLVVLAVFGAFLCLLPSEVFSQEVCSATVTPGGVSYSSIQSAIDHVTSPRMTITVGGTCEENVFISELYDYLSIKGPATIIGRNDTIGPVDNSKRPVIQTIGKGTSIENLTIKGGLDGIQVIRGGSAFIENNTIEENSRSGIILSMNSYAHIINNIIRTNAADGVMIADNSNARIGIKTRDDESASPNTIQGNGYGITVVSSSSAIIAGNTISQSTYDGIRVAQVSQADISDNTINANGRFGIFVTQNSGVNLGRDTGDNSPYNQPNKTTVGNGEKGLFCTIGGYADGRLGTLNGVGNHNQTKFTKDCINSLIP